jgi:branched-chain amino acid transport system permease protein
MVGATNVTHRVGTMDAILLQILNGLDKGSAYALIALGLTLIFGTLGVVNFAHGALFMVGSFCAVTLQRILTLGSETPHATKLDFLGQPVMVKTPYVESMFGEAAGAAIIDWSVPLAILFAIPIMVSIGFIMERGLIKHFYKRPHADQILVTFGLAIVLQEVIKYFFGANPIPTPAPAVFAGSLDFGVLFGFDPNAIIYPFWRLVYFLFSLIIIAAVFAFLQFTTFGMVVRAGMADRETVGLLGINIDKRFTIMFGIAAAVAGLAGVMYTPINSPNYHMGMDFLVLSFVVVVVGGMGSLPGAVLAGFLLGILESFASMNEIKSIIPGIDQIIIYLIAIVILLARPRGLMGRKGVMEE